MPGLTSGFEKEPRPRVLLSMTTFLSLPGKLEQAIIALDSIRRVHAEADWRRVDEVLVVNEVPAASGPAKDEGAATFRAVFPAATFVQKRAGQRGQAASLNLILDRLAAFDVWIHWEESWGCTRPFLAAAILAVAGGGVTQLQISTDIWRQASAERLAVQGAPLGEDIIAVAPHPRFLEISAGLSLETLAPLWRAWGLEVIWPLFSLRPSVNGAPFYRQLGPFLTADGLWPHLFEWEFGMRWIRAGGRKAILGRDAAQRLPGHLSTHRLVARG